MPDLPEPAVSEPGDAPTLDALRRTIAEQTPLLTGPTLHDAVMVRVRRALTSVDELLTLLGEEDDDLSRDTVARAVAWLVESVGAYQRLPAGFASGHAVTGEHAPMLGLVDDLDLLGLTLDHVYDAVRRNDAEHAHRQRAVLLDRFPTTTPPGAVVDEVGISTEHLDDQVLADHGLQVGDDGVPRLPVPEQPDPHHDPAAPGPRTQEDE